MNSSLRFGFFNRGKGATILFLLVLVISGIYFSFYSEDKNNIEQPSVLANQGSILNQFYSAPLYFEKNEGQIDHQFKYLTRCPGHVLYFAPSEVFVSLKQSKKEGAFAALNIQFVNANRNSLIKGIDKQECKSNYFIGNDSTQWHRAIPNYAKISYENLYPGIDAIFYGNAKQLEYDFYIAPGINPNQVRMRLQGAKDLAIDHEGNLQIVMEDKQIVQMKKPLIYQELAGNKVEISGQFVLLAANEVGFAVNDYDRSKQLVIDPILTYSSYLGGNGLDQGFGIAVDSQGSAYVTGNTQSPNFPTTAGAYRSTLQAGAIQNVFITKFNPAGAGLVYSTYLGSTGTDSSSGIVVNSAGEAYITGDTDSGDFPFTDDAFQTIKGGAIETAFISRLNANGSDLIYSTFLGGEDNSDVSVGTDIDIDTSGNAYVIGYTNSAVFPTTAGAYQTASGGATRTVFISKLNPNGTDLIYSTYLGGGVGSFAQGFGIAVDRMGYAYLTGDATDFRVTSGAFQTLSGGGRDGFITKLNQNGTDLIYSTLIGGSSTDTSTSIDFDTEGNAYVTGLTQSPNFPVTEGAFQTLYPVGATQQSFITKLNSTGTDLIYSTLLGGSVSTAGNDIAVDDEGHAYAVGYTSSSNFSITPNAIQTSVTPVDGGDTGYITKLNSTGSALLYSTYFGGTGGDNQVSAIALDANDNAYITGLTDSTDFPTTSGAFQTVNGGGENDAYVAKLALGAPVVTGVSPQVGSVTGGTVVTITGINLGNTTAVYFGEASATTFTIDSDTQLTAVSPAHALGTVDITVVAVGTSAITTADQFTYILTPTMTTLTVLPNPAKVGESVVLRASIAPSSATGSVTFFDGVKLLAVKTLSNGTATFTTDSLKVGKHFIIASYSGDNVNLGSVSSVVTLRVKSAGVPVAPLFPPRKLR